MSRVRRWFRLRRQWRAEQQAKRRFIAEQKIRRQVGFENVVRGLQQQGVPFDRTLEQWWADQK